MKNFEKIKKYCSEKAKKRGLKALSASYKQSEYRRIISAPMINRKTIAIFSIAQ